jgi:hypothetical protein
MTMVPNLQPNMRWDILKDFEPVSLVATIEWGLIASNTTSYRIAADLIAAAKAAPGKIDYGSGGPGSPQHLAMAMFASAAGISLIHVPYKGATQAATDVAAGQIPRRLSGPGYGCGAGAWRPAQTARRNNQREVAAISRRADRFGIRSAWILLQLMVRDSRARRHATGSHRQVEWRSPESAPGFRGSPQT